MYIIISRMKYYSVTKLYVIFSLKESCHMGRKETQYLLSDSLSFCFHSYIFHITKINLGAE